MSIHLRHVVGTGLHLHSKDRQLTEWSSHDHSELKHAPERKSHAGVLRAAGKKKKKQESQLPCPWLHIEYLASTEVDKHKLLEIIQPVSSFLKSR